MAREVGTRSHSWRRIEGESGVDLEILPGVGREPLHLCNCIHVVRGCNTGYHYFYFCNRKKYLCIWLMRVDHKRWRRD